MSKIASDHDLTRILARTGAIAMVGASDNPQRDSNAVLKFLLDRGFRVFPVNPAIAGSSLHGAPVFASLKDIPGPIDMVDVFRASAAVDAIVDEILALAARPKYLWMQLGVINEPAAARARAAGVTVVMDRCLKIELQRL